MLGCARFAQRCNVCDMNVTLLRRVSKTLLAKQPRDMSTNGCAALCCAVLRCCVLVGYSMCALLTHASRPAGA